MSSQRLAAVCVFVPGLALAADLGRLTVQSGAGEPMRAEVEIHSVRPGEAATLAARIPPPQVFWRANLEPSPTLDRLRVAVERRPGNRLVVAIRSNEPIDEPFIQLLVELASGTGSVVREYPFLLEESRARGQRAIAAPVPPAAEPPPQRTLAQAAPDRPAGYVVKPGDTLGTIAQGRRVAGASLEQMVVAMYQANEQAFVDANLNRLRAGRTLAIPSDEAVRAIDPEEARRILLGHRAAYEGYLRQAAAGAPPDAGRRVEAPPPPTPKTERDRLRVSSAESPKAGASSATTAREDDVASVQRALAEAQARIGLLEKNLDDVRRLAALKDHHLARMARQAHAAIEAAPLAGDAAAAGEADYERDAVSRFLGYYGGWLVLGFLLGFASWVMMPLKTVMLWRKKRRKRERDLWKRNRQRVRQAAREAGLLSTSV